MFLPYDPPPLPDPPLPLAYFENEVTRVAQGACRSGFMDTDMLAFTTMGMGPCCCVALYYSHHAREFGALMHFDGQKLILNNGRVRQFDVGMALDAAIMGAGLDLLGVKANCRLFIAYSTPDGRTMTALRAELDLRVRGYNTQAMLPFRHNGSAALCIGGQFVDQDRL